MGALDAWEAQFCQFMRPLVQMYTLREKAARPLKSVHLYPLPLSTGVCAVLVEGVFELLGKWEFFEVDNPHAAIAMPVE